MRFGRISFVLLTMLVSGAAPTVAQDTWRRTYGALDDEIGYSVRRVQDDLFIAIGVTGSFGAGASDAYLAGIDGSGDLLWSKTIGGPGVDRISRSRVGPNGEIWAVGYTNGQGAGGYDGWLLRLDAAGTIISEFVLGGSDWDLLHDLRILPDGGLVLVGETYSDGHPAGAAWVIRTDAAGAVQWSRTYADPLNCEAHAVSISLEGDILVAGSVVTANGDRDVLLVRYTADGDEQWAERFGGEEDDLARDLVACADGGFSIMGSTASYSDWTEAYHLKVNAAGEEQWYRNWGQINDQEAFEHYELPAGGFISIGYTRTSGGGGRDMFLLRSDAVGEFVFGRTFGGVADEEGFSLDLLDDGYLLGGYSQTYGAGGKDLFVVRTDLNGTTANDDVESSFDPLNVVEEPIVQLPLYPNPSQGVIHVPELGQNSSFSWFDLQGALVHSDVVAGGASTVTVPLPNGVYSVVRTSSDGRSATGRVVILRP